MPLLKFKMFWLLQLNRTSVGVNVKSSIFAKTINHSNNQSSELWERKLQLFFWASISTSNEFLNWDWFSQIITSNDFIPCAKHKHAVAGFKTLSECWCCCCISAAYSILLFPILRTMSMSKKDPSATQMCPQCSHNITFSLIPFVMSGEILGGWGGGGKGHSSPRSIHS